jgi:hypothetical protein
MSERAQIVFLHNGEQLSMFVEKTYVDADGNVEAYSGWVPAKDNNWIVHVANVVPDEAST